ncbi:Uncharacterized protein TCM_004793 [Theobroma cacao]|uniref:Uncharacterized protein n=1 Tax=Theobroma cacao TaxID=3641 RepID=A0A061DR34_THECC|nr:Uncharacterized protein TCM_004793 [Theobroma cacao]
MSNSNFFPFRFEFETCDLESTTSESSGHQKFKKRLTNGGDEGTETELFGFQEGGGDQAKWWALTLSFGGDTMAHFTRLISAVPGEASLGCHVYTWFMKGSYEPAIIELVALFIAIHVV